MQKNIRRFGRLQYYKALFNKEYIFFRVKRLFIQKFPWLYAKIFYKKIIGKKLRYNNPQNIEEKLFWIARYWQHPLIVQCSDKYRMRQYVGGLGLDHILVPLLGVYENANLINFDNLPNKFVLKCNHGCGLNIICRDKNKLDYRKTKDQLNYWLERPYGLENAEYHYTKIKPIITCESFLENNHQYNLVDYKVQCFNGVPHSFLVIAERGDDSHDNIKLSYSLKWERLNYIINEDECTYSVPKPESLLRMIEYAKKMSNPFPYCRVDFYEVNGKPFLGELTFFPVANILSYYYKSYVLDEMGKLIKLPKRIK